MHSKAEHGMCGKYQSMPLPKAERVIRELKTGQACSLRIFILECGFYFHRQSSLEKESEMIRSLSQKNNSESRMQNEWEGYQRWGPQRQCQGHLEACTSGARTD